MRSLACWCCAADAGIPHLIVACMFQHIEDFLQPHTWSSWPESRLEGVLTLVGQLAQGQHDVAEVLHKDLVQLLLYFLKISMDLVLDAMHSVGVLE